MVVYYCHKVNCDEWWIGKTEKPEWETNLGGTKLQKCNNIHQENKRKDLVTKGESRSQCPLLGLFFGPLGKARLPPASD